MDIDKLQSLEEMLLYNNELTSTIPNGMTLLNNVLRLSLSYNYLKGTIPSEISKMEHLTLLLLHGNRVMGTLDIGQLVDSITDCGKTIGCSQLQESLWIKKLMNDAKSASVASTLECLGSAYFSTN